MLAMTDETKALLKESLSERIEVWETILFLEEADKLPKLERKIPLSERIFNFTDLLEQLNDE